jgi:hypothetical protein
MKHILNGAEVTPLNYENIGFVVDYSQPASDILSVTADSLTFANEARAAIMQHVLSGPGALEGIPYQIITETGQTLEYFLNCADKFEVKDNTVSVALHKRWNQQQFMNQANGTSFELLAQRGVQFPIFDVPYLIIKDNQLETGITLAITTFVMGQALADAIRTTADLTAAVISAVGVDVTDVIAAAIKLAAQILYTVALLLAFKKLVEQLIELIFPKIRYFKACKLRDLIAYGCQHLGYTLESSLLDSMSNVTILPVPIIRQKESILDYWQNDLNFAFTKGYPTAQDSIPTLGAAIDTALNWFNGKLFVRDSVVRIERRDFAQQGQQVTLDPALALQGERSDRYTLNTPEVWRRQYIHYATDGNDWHTFNEFERTDCEDSTEPINVVNQDLVLIKGYRDVAIPFALGSRKSDLTWVEKRVRSLLQIVDEVTGAFGSGTNYAAAVNARIGVLQIGEQFFTQTKALWTVGAGGQFGARQPQNYLNFIGARQIEQQFHDIEFIGVNDFIIREAVDVAVTSAQFDLLQNVNYVTINGQPCEILRVEFYDYNNRAKVFYKEPFNWATNVQKIAVNS